MLTHHSWQCVHRFGHPPLSPPQTPTTTTTSPFRSGSKTTRINTTISAFAFQNKSTADIFGLADFHRLRSKSRKREGLIKRTDTKGTVVWKGLKWEIIALGFSITHHPRVKSYNHTRAESPASVAYLYDSPRVVRPPREHSSKRDYSTTCNSNGY